MKIVRELYRGYASITYAIEADEGEILTKEGIEDKFGSPFGCHVSGCCATCATVTVYTD